MIIIRECSICHRALNQLDDPFSVDCGGDCIVCMADADDPDCVKGLIEIAHKAMPPRLDRANQPYEVVLDRVISYSSRSIDGDVRPL